jgi:hypothetical protein
MQRIIIGWNRKIKILRSSDQVQSEKKLIKDVLPIHWELDEWLVYKGFISIQSKVNLKQFEETINLGDTPIEFMNQSAALRETLSFDQHCIGSKDRYESELLFSYQAKIWIEIQVVDLILKRICLNN